MLGNGFRLDPDFRKLWIGQAISQIGSNITGVGLPLTAVLVLKASPLLMGFLSGAGAAAVLIMLHWLTIGDLYVVAVVSSILTVLFDVS